MKTLFYDKAERSTIKHWDENRIPVKNTKCFVAAKHPGLLRPIPYAGLSPCGDACKDRVPTPFWLSLLAADQPLRSEPPKGIGVVTGSGLAGSCGSAERVDCLCVSYVKPVFFGLLSKFSGSQCNCGTLSRKKEDTSSANGKSRERTFLTMYP